MARASNLSETGIRLDERKRMHDILSSPEGQRNPALARELVLQGSTATAALAILKLAPADNPYLTALDGLAIGISGPASNVMQPEDPQAARRAQIAAAGAEARAARGVRR